jgi:LuxR family maltose regulon positive regulatory protein
LLTVALLHDDAGDGDRARMLLQEARDLLESCPDPGGVVLERLERVERRRRPKRTPSAAVNEADLSERELEVLRLLASPLSQREIGEALYVSLNTIKTHTRQIFRKLGVSTRKEAVARARDRGLVT